MLAEVLIEMLAEMLIEMLSEILTEMKFDDADKTSSFPLSRLQM